MSAVSSVPAVPAVPAVSNVLDRRPNSTSTGQCQWPRLGDRESAKPDAAAFTHAHPIMSYISLVVCQAQYRHSQGLRLIALTT